MKKLLILGLVLTMSFAAALSAYAEYVPPTGFSANREYNTRLYSELDKAKADVETYQEKVKSIEQKIADMQTEYEEADKICKELEAENKSGTNEYIKYDKVRIKYETTVQNLENAKKVLKEKENRVINIEGQLADLAQEHMEWTGYEPEGTEGDTYTFYLQNKDNKWVLMAGYRSWNPLMGGQWEYSTFIIPSLSISFYDSDNCLSDKLARAESQDTETSLAWAVPGNIENGKRYYIEISGKRYGVVAHTDSYFTDPSAGNLESSGSLAGGNTYSNTDYNSESNQIKGWYQENGLWKVNDSLGNLIVNAWFCDLDGSWYLLDERGYMREGIINDNGHYYSLETDHAGYYGKMRTIDGVYNGVELKFNQEHNGYYGEIVSGLDKLIDAGITVIEIDGLPSDYVYAEE